MADTREERAVAAFVREIDVRPVGQDRFLADPDKNEEDDRIFGGRTLAQAVVASGRTAEDFTIHSLHAYFLRPGRPGEAITYAVDRTRDGRTFAGRRVSALQGQNLIFEAMVSFVRPEDGITHQLPAPHLPKPANDSVLANREEIVRRWGSAPVFDMAEDRAAPGSYRQDMPHQNQWWRPAAQLPDDPIIHAAALAWVSDNSLYATIFEHYGLPPGVTLDHAIWWHQPPRFDDWVLRVSDSPAANSARALMLSSMFSSNGLLVASVAQEGLFRSSW